MTKRDMVSGAGVLFLVYGGGMLHAAIPPIVVGVAMIAYAIRGMAEVVEPSGDDDV